MRAHFDAFVAKQESVAMSREDEMDLERNERSLERAEQLTRDKERCDVANYWSVSSILTDWCVCICGDRRLQEWRRLVLEGSAELDEFLQFSRREFAEDLVRFWIAVEEFKMVRLWEAS